MVLYFARFHKNKDNQFEVNFPDLDPYAATYGDTLKAAVKSAHEALTGYLLTAEDSNEKVPEPTDPSNQVVGSDDFLVPIEVDLDLEREKERHKYIKKTLTIPQYLNTSAKNAGLNFSALLADAIREKLNID